MEGEEFRAAARAWLAANAGDAPRDYGAILPPDLVDAGRGLAAAPVRRAASPASTGRAEFGGRGLTAEHTRASGSRSARRAGVPPLLNMVGLVLAGGAILRFGTPEQQERYLRPTLRGDQVWCQLFSEPGAGSDLARSDDSRRARRRAFVVNGQKVWCSGGRYSDWGILMARTDPERCRSTRASRSSCSTWACPASRCGRCGR